MLSITASHSETVLPSHRRTVGRPLIGFECLRGAYPQCQALPGMTNGNPGAEERYRVEIGSGRSMIATTGSSSVVTRANTTKNQVS